MNVIFIDNNKASSTPIIDSACQTGIHNKKDDT